MHLTGSRLLALVAAFVVGAAVVGGCGGDDTSAGGDGGDGASTATATVPSQPPAKGSADEFATQMAKLVATTKAKKDCGPLNAINQRSSYKQFACPVPKQVRDSLALFEITKSATHDTAAIVDYRTGAAPSGATMLAYKTPGGEWSIGRYGLLNYSVDREPDTQTRRKFERVAADYVKAVRSRDCETFGDTALTATQDEKVYCRREFKGSLSLAKLLKQNPDARPEYLGGDAKFGFFALRTQKPKPGYYTIGIIDIDSKAINRYKVIDVVGGPPDA
jgi:hypothetical protein